MVGEQPTIDRSRTRGYRWILIGGLVAAGIALAFRLHVDEGESGPIVFLQRLVLVGVIGVLLWWVIQKLLKHLPAHPILAALACSFESVILSVPAFGAFNILIPTQGKQAHMWGDVEMIGRFFNYILFGIPGAAVLGAVLGTCIAVNRPSDSGTPPHFVK